MMLCHPKRFKTRNVGFRAVSGVGFPSIARKLLRKRNHHPVPRHFRHNGSGSDRQAASVPLHQRFGRTGQSLWCFVAIYQREFGWFCQSFNGAPHRQQRGLQDVDPIDFFHTNVKNGNIGLVHNLIEKGIPPLC